MRILWIAGLGAVLVTGGVSAQGMNAPTPGSTNERALQMQPADQPDQIRRAQDPRLTQGRMGTQQNMGQPAPIPPALRGSANQQEPDRIREAQDPRLGQSRLPARSNVQSGGSGDGMRGEGMQRDRATGTGAMGRTDAPRNPADRAYMGGGLILENGRPVPLPGDAPGAASDFRADNVGQSTARGERPSGGTVDVLPGQRRADPASLAEPSRPYNPQTNVGQTGVRDQGMTGTSQGAFPANPPTPGGRVPTGN
jgi:hypothetical protein